ncbi:MAG: phosphoribosyltransferase [Deltaproteobacteria bacterium]|nr:phosphoribosyltransferase [Deltaproteobacteria bacterium]
MKNVTDNDIEKVRQWLNLLEPYVGIRDCLALSFASDYDSEDGNPGSPFTKVGSLRKLAKTYGKAPTHASLAAADELTKLCLNTLRELTCYDSATCVVAVPPSDPGKPYNLPRHIATGIAARLGKKDLCGHVKTNQARQSVRGTPCDEKLPVIEGTVSVTPGVFEGKSVLLIDDLYQSGVTMNYVAMLILEAGAEKVFGLACEKTCSNDDNVSRR